MTTTKREDPGVKAGKVDQAALRYGIGTATMRKLAEEAHAVVRIGKLYLVNYSIVDAYIDKLSQ